MARRASLKGKGQEIFYPSGEKNDEAAAPEPSAAAPPTKTAEAGAAPSHTGRKSRAKKPQPQATPPVKMPAVTVAFTPPPATPVAKTPAPVNPAPPMPSASSEPSRTPPPASTVNRAVPPPSLPPAGTPPPPPPPPPVDLTTSARYDRLSTEIDALYEVATRKIAAGRGVGQSMQWLRDARQLVMNGKAADFAGAELLVRQVSGLLQHGDEIDVLYADVLEQVGDSPDLVEKCMNMLRDARQKIASGAFNDLIEAEFSMEEVKGILVGVQKSRQASHSWSARFLWFWLVGWVVLFLLVFIFDKPIAETIYYLGLKTSSGVPSSVVDLMLPWLCLVWGGVGSVFDTLVAINENMAKRTYDGHYTAQGFATPLYGALLGTLIYFLFAGGLIALGTGMAFSSTMVSSSLAGTQPGTAEPQSGTVLQTTAAISAARSLALWLIAFLAGFFHQRTIELLGKIFDQILITLKILPEKKEEEEKQPPSSVAPSAPLVAPSRPPAEPGAAPTPVAGVPAAPISPASVPPAEVPGGSLPVSTTPPPAQPLPPDGPPLPPEGPPPGETGGVI